MSKRISSIGLALTVAMTGTAVAGNKPDSVGTKPGQEMKAAAPTPSSRGDTKGASTLAPGQENKPASPGASLAAPGKNK
jgi:hypothetical protein